MNRSITLVLLLLAFPMGCSIRERTPEASAPYAERAAFNERQRDADEPIIPASTQPLIGTTSFQALPAGPRLNFYLPPDQFIPAEVRNNPGCTPGGPRVLSDWTEMNEEGQWYNTCLLRLHEGVGVCHENMRDHFPVVAAGPFMRERGGWVPGTVIAEGPEDCFGQWVFIPWRVWNDQGGICGPGCRDNLETLAVRVNIHDSYTEDNDDSGHWGQHGAIGAPGLDRFGVRDGNGNLDMLVHVTGAGGPMFAIDPSRYRIRW